MRWQGWRSHPEEKNGGGWTFFSGGRGLARRSILKAYPSSKVGGKYSKCPNGTTWSTAEGCLSL